MSLTMLHPQLYRSYSTLGTIAAKILPQGPQSATGQQAFQAM